MPYSNAKIWLTEVSAKPLFLYSEKGEICELPSFTKTQTLILAKKFSSIFLWENKLDMNSLHNSPENFWTEPKWTVMICMQPAARLQSACWFTVCEWLEIIFVLVQ